VTSIDTMSSLKSNKSGPTPRRPAVDRIVVTESRNGTLKTPRGVGHLCKKGLQLAGWDLTLQVGIEAGKHIRRVLLKEGRDNALAVFHLTAGYWRERCQQDERHLVRPVEGECEIRLVQLALEISRRLAQLTEFFDYFIMSHVENPPSAVW
jgi:hypothetical protein